MVVVLEGRTGHELLRIPATGTVWAVSTLVEENDMRVAFGGECSTLVVYSLDQRKEVLELPVEEVVYDVGVTADALAYANGRRASMYGKGGTQFSWQDQPSFAVLSSLIETMMHSEKQLLRSLRLVTDRHPAVVNARHPRTGISLLQFVIEHCNHAAVLETLLEVDGRLALHALALALHHVHDQSGLAIPSGGKFLCPGNGDRAVAINNTLYQSTVRLETQ